MENYYEILGVRNNFTAEELTKAYKEKVKEHHPDLNQSNIEDAEAKTASINVAYEVLSNSEKRKKYDRKLFGENYIPTIIRKSSSSHTNSKMAPTSHQKGLKGKNVKQDTTDRYKSKQQQKNEELNSRSFSKQTITEETKNSQSKNSSETAETSILSDEEIKQAQKRFELIQKTQRKLQSKKENGKTKKEISKLNFAIRLLVVIALILVLLLIIV